MSQSCPKLFLCMLFFSFLISHCSASDCLEDGSKIIDGSSQSNLLSPSKVFELGFFTPDGSFNRNRYLGIWYYRSNPRIVVWVANRDKPVLGNNGYVVVKGGKVEVLSTDDSTYWKTTDSVASVNLTKLCLNDSGNLILSSGLGESILWQSFDHPTDTILPGMFVNETLKMTSWINRSDPAFGSSLLLLQPGKEFKITVQEQSYPEYWDSRADPSAKIPSSLSELLTNGDRKVSLLNNTRLVMNVTGQVQLWKQESEGGWSLDWQEPEDRCSFNTVCGNFGSCNSHSGLPCKCLPGFTPSSTPEWNTGCFSGGCVPVSEEPCQRKDTFSNDTFLELPMMKVGEEGCSASSSSVEDCKTQCLHDCTCVAYAFGSSNCSGAPTLTEKSCLTWSNQVSQLKEEYSQGLTLFVRVPSSDLGSSSRTCKPCGAYAIPYPLSTGASCGDSSYSKFHCNSDTGQVNFSTSTGTFRVSLIDPDAEQFSIQVMHANSCDSEYINTFVLSTKLSFPFFVKNCTIYKDKPLIQLGQPFIEVEIGWKPPLEPICSVSSDCVAWPRTTCKTAKGHTKRCMCRSDFHWDGSKLKCVRVPFPLKAVVCCIAVALAMIVLCGIYFVYRKRERRITEKKDSFKVKGDDAEDVDVPFFGWGSILSATNNFADANKLGTGGFGSVYRGKLPDGEDIAVKRLSRVSMQGVAEFTTEVVLIAKLQHRNLVRLLGYCVKADENILVYEYMHNGSLDSCLFDQTFSVYLDWKKRYDIILGIARGLVYLHQDSRLRIIHRDLKPSNILLDEELNPKIADFGLARIFGGKETVANTDKIVGTHGYMSPEYACEGYFSIKSDVFSFGVVVLETISGRRNSRTTVFEQGLNLLGHAWRLWSEDKGLEFIDPTLKESCNPTEVLKCIYLGLLCVQDDPIDRPTMPDVILMLRSSNESTVNQSLPKKPSFFCSSSSRETGSSSSLGGFSSFCNAITVSTVGR